MVVYQKQVANVRDSARARAPRPVLAPRSEFVLGGRLADSAVGALAREVGNGAGEFAHRATDCDAEHALPALQQVDDLFSRRALVDGGPVGEQRDAGQILHPTLPQVVDGDPDVLQ